jgi:hypothetical protein
MKRLRAVQKVQLYCFFATGACLVSLLNVIGYTKLLDQGSHAASTRNLAIRSCSNRNNESQRALSWGLYQLALNDSAASQGTGLTIQEDMLSPPQTMLLDFVRRHSADSLRRETPEQFRKRKFAIAYYSCPLQLGNQLFHFMNSILWAVITDRTVLYKYMDKRTCERLKEHQPMLYLSDAICQAANTVKDCDVVLERAPWLPSYDEFVDPSWEIHRVDFWQTHWFSLSPQWIRIRYLFDESKHMNLTKVDRIKFKLVEFPALTNADSTWLTKRFTRQKLLSTSGAKTRARKLTKKGLRFTYGMFFSEMFRLRDKEFDLVNEYYPKPDGKESNLFSIALHSRHKLVKQKGRNIQNEGDCLDKVLANRPANHSCRVCAMSDRPLALETLKAWLEQKHHCDLIQVHHLDQTSSFSVEHGLNAGAAFVRELDVCHRYGIHGVITTSTGSASSSSALLESLADYNNNKNYDGSNYINVETQYCSAYST